jgi:hypothetical protein
MKIREEENFYEINENDEEWKNFLHKTKKLNHYMRSLRTTIVFSIFFERRKLWKDLRITQILASSFNSKFYSNVFVSISKSEKTSEKKRRIDKLKIRNYQIKNAKQFDQRSRVTKKKLFFRKEKFSFCFYVTFNRNNRLKRLNNFRKNWIS